MKKMSDVYVTMVAEDLEKKKLLAHGTLLLELKLARGIS
jgi:hypothetical protein